jgi:hypothetical protein
MATRIIANTMPNGLNMAALMHGRKVLNLPPANDHRWRAAL